MRTTISLDEHVLAKAKEIGARTGRTLAAVIEDALRAAFARESPSYRTPRPELPTYGGRGLRAGVYLDDTAGLLDLMEGDGR